jgi:hypothetical protein
MESQLRPTIPANIAHAPMMNSMLNTADPTIVPTPTSLFAINTPESLNIYITSLIQDKTSSEIPVFKKGKVHVENNVFKKKYLFRMLDSGGKISFQETVLRR